MRAILHTVNRPAPTSLRARAATLLSSTAGRLCLASTAVLWLIAALSPSPMGDLIGSSGDHLRHVTMSWLAGQHGLRVWTTPMAGLLAETPSPLAHSFLVNLTYVYPPGALALFAPAALAEHGVGVPSRLVAWGLIAGMVAAAHGLAWLVAREARPLGDAARVLLTGLVGLEAAHWALNGQYDPVALILVVLSMAAMRRGDARAAAARWTGAALLHYRALLFLPLLLLALVRWWRTPRRPDDARWALAIALGLGLAAAGFALVLAYAPPLPNNNRIALVRAGVTPDIQLLALLTAAAALALLRLGQALLGGTLMLVFVLLLFTRQAQPWHGQTLLLLPLLAGIGARRPETTPLAGGIAALWVAWIYVPLYRAWPDPRWLLTPLSW